MQRVWMVVGLAILPLAVVAQQPAASPAPASPAPPSAATAGASMPSPTGPYKVLKTVKVGGDGGFDYVYADSASRKLYVPRMGPAGHVGVYDLDTLAAAGDITGVSGHGVAVDPASHHGFATSKPVAMFDANTLAPIKTIDVQGNPDGILGDPFNGRIYILSHAAPNAR